MIGRTPEYVGKKIEANEIKMTMLALLTVPAFILGLGAAAAVLPAGLAGLNNAGPHGFSELLYAYTSGTATNGSAFAGLNAGSSLFRVGSVHAEVECLGATCGQAPPWQGAGRAPNLWRRWGWRIARSLAWLCNEPTGALADARYRPVADGFGTGGAMGGVGQSL
jgi:hypothetical protein